MKCSRCSRTAVVELKYFKEFLCNRCFRGLFEKRVKRNIRVNKLLGKRDKVAVGLSGLRDSMALLFVLRKIFFKAPQSRLIAITIDDGRLPRVRLTKEFCSRMDVEHHIRGIKRKLGVWGTLVEKAKSLGINKIALGVNLEDEVLLVLEGIMRGRVQEISSPKAKGGVKVIKPLRECPAGEIELYARLNKIEYIKEKSGGGRFKKTLQDMLDEIESKQPGSKFKLLKSTGRYREVAGKAGL